MSPSFDTLELHIEQQVATVSLNRPDKANSMNAAMWAELQACFEWLDEEPAVRAVILAGNGKHFCAGLDLAMFGNLHGASSEPARRAEHLRRTILRLQDNLSAIEKCRKPVLAAIHNTCIGGGVDMTCCADMRYATEDAYFSIREIDIGMTADVGTLQRLPKLIPDGAVRELAYTGRAMDAEEARELGFVNRVYEDRETMLRERMYFERLESIATMVTGVAHEMGTPLGVANTANSIGQRNATGRTTNRAGSTTAGKSARPGAERTSDTRIIPK